MTGQAMQKALDHIGDAFREERKERQHIVLQGRRVQELVEAGRYSFPEACRKMQVDAEQVAESFFWLIDDNARLNVLYNTTTHRQSSFDFMMVGWFGEQAQKQHSAQVIPFGR
jgi:hypothetical protein